MVRIDSRCIYVPAQYAGRLIVFCDPGDDPTSASTSAGKAVSVSGEACVNHTRNSPKRGNRYEVYAWGPIELIGSAIAE